MALYLEKEHLRGAEESDYQLLEGLIHQRLTREPTDSDKFDNNAFFLTVDQASSPEFKTHVSAYSTFQFDVPVSQHLFFFTKMFINFQHNSVIIAT